MSLEGFAWVWPWFRHWSSLELKTFVLDLHTFLNIIRLIDQIISPTSVIPIVTLTAIICPTKVIGSIMVIMSIAEIVSCILKIISSVVKVVPSIVFSLCKTAIFLVPFFIGVWICSISVSSVILSLVMPVIFVWIKIIIVSIVWMSSVISMAKLIVIFSLLKILGSSFIPKISGSLSINSLTVLWSFHRFSIFPVSIQRLLK